MYVDGELALDVEKSRSDWQSAVADVLDGVDEAVESEGSVDACGAPPNDLSGWTGLEPIERYDEDALRRIIGIWGLGVLAVLVINDEFIFGEDVFFPDVSDGLM